jgi:phosphoribosylformimino-5-aminoimidazole carboxamide ribotide isomerase
MGLSAVIFTDIERDGRNRSELADDPNVGQATSIPVIASGGVSGLEDIKHLMALGPGRIMGVIVGRALYTGRVDLEEALRLTEGRLV